jgi:pyruvate dehydrogenase E2 component (dihydrolipoamide acetyltransferase)
MPALSPTMKEGKILKWLKKPGDKVEAGDAIAEIETDKATMAFEVQEKGYIAKTINNEDFIPLGSPVVVITKKADDVSQFKDYVFGSSEQATSATSSATSSPSAQEAPKAPAQSSAKSYPAHSFLQ